MKAVGRRLRGVPVVVPPEHQTDAFLDQANPTLGAYYEVLAATSNVRILGIGIRCTWTVQPASLRIRVTIDGQVIEFTMWTPANNTWYYPEHIPNTTPATQTAFTNAFMRQRASLLEGRNIQVEAVVNGGTVSNLRCRVVWARW